MNAIDFDLEYEILNACFKAFPQGYRATNSISVELGVPEHIIEAEIAYLIESGLLRSDPDKSREHGSRALPITAYIFITAKGIDYLNNGGIGARINQFLTTGRA